MELIKAWELRVPVVHIDSTPNTDQVYPADVEFVGAMAVVLEAFRAAGRGGGARWSEAEVRKHRTELFDEYYSGRVAGKLNPSDVVDTVRQALPATTIATTDVGSHKLLVGQGWRTHEPRSLLMSNGLSSMGFSACRARSPPSCAPRPAGGVLHRRWRLRHGPVGTAGLRRRWDWASW